MTLPAALPPIVPQPFAQNAPGGNINTPIPNTTGTAGLASYDQGFPTDTMQPVVAGGVPPEGQDFNGILFAITAHLYYLQSGQRWQFNGTVAAAIGGYPVGAQVASTDGVTVWSSLVANNTDDPDATGNISWEPASNYGALGLNVSNANITLSPQQAKFKLLIFVGVLTANVSIIFPPLAKDWLLVNLTTGNFNITARLAASVGVNVPQGGYANPLGIYGGAVTGSVPQMATEIYPTVSPLGVPISVSAVPSTLVERDNNAYVYAVAFNQRTASDNVTVTQVATGRGDGFINWNDLGNFEGQMDLANIAGAAIPAQITSACVTQYIALILASAALTGTPTTPTQGVGTANTTVASTAFVNPGSSLSANGYRRNPDGSIDQWGSFNFTANGGTIGVSFPIAFPSQCFSVVTDVIAPSGLGGAGSYQADQPAAPTAGGFSYRSTSSSNPSITVMWRAIGK
jgi:hypothetical protein